LYSESLLIFFQCDTLVSVPRRAQRKSCVQMTRRRREKCPINASIIYF